MSLSEPSSQTTSPSLLIRLRQREGEAWQQMVDLYGPLIVNWCRRKGLSKDDGADVVQNVFFSVARGLHHWQPETGRDGCFRAWLWTITKNRIIDFYRAKPFDGAAGGSSNLQRLNETHAPINLDDAEPTEELDLSELVGRAIQLVEASVEPRTWQAFWRYTIDGVGMEAVAAELQMSAASVRQARSRILRRIREQLGDC